MLYIAKAWNHRMPNGPPAMVPMIPVAEQLSFIGRLKAIRAKMPYVLVRDFIYTGKNGVSFMIPRGFCTDFGSTPRILWPFGLEPTGIIMICSLIHDFGYRHDFYLTPKKTMILKGKGRKFHDRLFKMVFEETTKIKILPLLSYIGLRLFGWYAWACNKKYRTGDLALKGEYYKLYKAQGFGGTK